MESLSVCKKGDELFFKLFSFSRSVKFYFLLRNQKQKEFRRSLYPNVKKISRKNYISLKFEIKLKKK